MKFLRQTMFTLVAVIGLTLAVSAQKDDQKRPPKGPPPQINPGDKKPPKNPPKEDKPKKPETSWYFVSRESGEDLA